MMTAYLNREDYEEGCCSLDMDPSYKPIPVGRVQDKLDALLGRNDYAAAERLLDYWQREAAAGHDDRGLLAVRNEQIGLFRKLGRREDGLRVIADALTLAHRLYPEPAVTLGTTLINAATGYKAFDMPEEALPLYRQAKTVYESRLDPSDERLGGLYNNMALTLAALGASDEARALFGSALHVMSQQTHGEAESAITYLNLADLTADEMGTEAGEAVINGYLDRAEALLNTESLPRDGYYAFVCEKCAPVFGCYGRFMTELELTEKARAIHEGT